ncbi:hypothetical protein CDAR_528191 [Caerostris darwini]|uniref:Uncharacterized protein n=1 Tax=Caerostris darwini TaxID=1538125 RepID=A0AAV4SYD4_9ARAC|nr:hypothetical protein CDAR_528191 [Caerostris darwini]
MRDDLESSLSKQCIFRKRPLGGISYIVSMEIWLLVIVLFSDLALMLLGKARLKKLLTLEESIQHLSNNFDNAGAFDNNKEEKNITNKRSR